MNLLVTNPQEIQAYTIMRSLRPHARRVVIAEGGDSVNHTGFEGMTPYSRFVDARHTVPRFAGDWLAGRLDEANTEAEEAYIRRIEEICRLESIDVVFPSLDPEVYVFAKNKQRLLAQGVTTVVPDLDVIRIPMDKGLTMEVAQRVGFPCPRTFFPETAADLGQILADSKPPWIVKPRFTAHGINMVLVENASELEGAYAKVAASHRRPIIQQYVGGTQRQNYYLTVDRAGTILSLLSPRSTRAYDWGKYRVSTKTAVSASNASHLDELRVLIRELGLWGGYTVQTKVDPIDGIPKLMEINARLGQHLWWRTGLGVNEPMIFLQLARGQQPSGDFRFRDGVTFLDPYHDFFVLYSMLVDGIFRAVDRLRHRGNAPLPDTSEGAGAGFRATLRLYAKDYFKLGPKVYCPEFSSFFSDPYPCLRAFWFKFRPVTAAYVSRITGVFTKRWRRLVGNL